MIFESHAHYDDSAFHQDREIILKKLPASGIEYVIDVGASLESTAQAIALAKEYDYVYAAAGVHPSEIAALDEKGLNWIKEQCKYEKVVAVGEIGLDYHYPDTQKEAQKEWFAKQLTLAEEVDLPVIVHSREAAKDTLDIMRGQSPIKKRGVVHCFSYHLEVAKEFLEMGYMLGIGGVITFKNAKKLREVVEYAPLDSLLLETDSPYLAPEPYRGKRNDSTYLPYIAREISRIKNLTYDEILEITGQNAKRLFLGK